MNILYLVAKKKFDLSLGRYLENYANVLFVANDPAEMIFLKKNGQEVLYGLDGAISRPIGKKAIGSLDWRRALEGVECFRLSRDEYERACIETFFLRYLRFLLDLFQEKRINLCLCHERDFLDTACAELAARLTGARIYYFSTGFFRGETLTVSPERIYFTDSAIWERRIAAKLKAPRLARSLPTYQTNENGVLFPSRIETAFSRLRVGFSPGKRRLLSYLRPKRPFLEGIRHRYKKKRIKSWVQPKVEIKEPFILVPLQGNEIFKLVDNPLSIKSQEHLAEVIIRAVDYLNRQRGTTFQVVLKEHPLRPFVISESFAKRFSQAVFLRKYDMDELLDKTEMVITYNSLAGFEALQKGKPVVMLGPLFYRLKGLVHWPKDTGELTETISRALDSSINQEKLQKLINYLKVKYEVKANRKGLSVKALHNIAQKVLGGMEDLLSETERSHKKTIN